VLGDPLKKVSLVFAMSVAFMGPAFAGAAPVVNSNSSPTFMVGISVEFGDDIKTSDVGITTKFLSTNRPNEFVLGSGISYFPWSNDKNGQIGLDLSAGYNFDHSTAMVGYDILRWKPQISTGYSWTKEQ
jgi:hypothetical protein